MISPLAAISTSPVYLPRAENVNALQPSTRTERPAATESVVAPPPASSPSDLPALATVPTVNPAVQAVEDELNRQRIDATITAAVADTAPELDLGSAPDAVTTQAALAAAARPDPAARGDVILAQPVVTQTGAPLAREPVEVVEAPPASPQTPDAAPPIEDPLTTTTLPDAQTTLAGLAQTVSEDGDPLLSLGGATDSAATVFANAAAGRLEAAELADSTVGEEARIAENLRATLIDDQAEALRAQNAADIDETQAERADVARQLERQTRLNDTANAVPAEETVAYNTRTTLPFEARGLPPLSANLGVEIDGTAAGSRPAGRLADPLRPQPVSTDVAASPAPGATTPSPLTPAAAMPVQTPAEVALDNAFDRRLTDMQLSVGASSPMWVPYADRGRDNTVTGIARPVADGAVASMAAAPAVEGNLDRDVRTDTSVDTTREVTLSPAETLSGQVAVEQYQASQSLLQAAPPIIEERV